MKYTIIISLIIFISKFNLPAQNSLNGVWYAIDSTNEINHYSEAHISDSVIIVFLVGIENIAIQKYILLKLMKQ